MPLDALSVAVCSEWTNEAYILAMQIAFSEQA
jgi:hypothetical protein